MNYLKKIIELLFSIFLLIFRFVSLNQKHKSGKIVVISLHKLGDTVFTIPAVKLIYKHFNKKNIYLITFPGAADIYKIFFNESENVTLKREDFWLNGRIASKNAREAINNLKPEVIVDLTGSIATATLLFNSKAKKIVGVSDRFYRALYNEFVAVRRTPHLIDRYLDVVKLIVPVKNSEVEYEFPTTLQEGKILIHPFAGWSAKEWNINKFIELAGLLNEEFVVEIVSAKNLIPEDIISEINKLQIQVSFTASINDLINKIKQCSIFLSNDSGPLYIASIFGKPTFTIYGPTNPEFSIPFGRNHGYIQKLINCSPEKDKQYCFTNAGRNGCPSFECMNLLQVKEVYDKLHSFFNELGIKHKLIKNEGP